MLVTKFWSLLQYLELDIIGGQIFNYKLKSGIIKPHGFSDSFLIKDSGKKIPNSYFFLALENISVIWKGKR